MKLSIKLVILLLVISTLTSGVFTIVIVEGYTWFKALNLIFELLLTGTLNDLSDLQFQSKLALYVVVFVGAAIQLGFIAFFVSLLIRLLVSQKEYFEGWVNDFIENNDSFRYIMSIVFLTIMFFSIVVIRTIENISWLDAIYFTIITISTVGFGDITVSHPISKVVTIVLIINGITFIGLASQYLIDRIVNLQLDKKYSLPSSPLNLENHIIIGGYGAKGRRLAQLFKERTYSVVIVDQDEERARLAEFNGFQVINGDITKPALLDILSLEKATGLFLLLSEDDTQIQSGIIARSIAPELDIYAEFKNLATYNIARYAGINKPVSLFGFLTNNLQSYLYQADEISLPQSLKELRQQETQLGFVQVPINFDFNSVFDHSFVIGELSIPLNELYLEEHLSLDYEKPSHDTTHLLLAVEKDELDKKLEGDQREDREIKRLVFAGYSELVESFVDRLDIPDEDIVVLWNRPEVAELLKQKNYKKYEWQLGNAAGLMETVIRDDDVVICSFEDITSSLLVGVTLNNLEDTKTRLIQLAPYEYDIEPLIKVGASIVFTPQQIISTALLSIFLKEKNLEPSTVFTNAHVYEHLVNPDDFFEGKRVIDLEDDNINILLIKKTETDEFRPSDITDKITAGDRILVFIKNKKKERLDIIS